MRLQHVGNKRGEKKARAAGGGFAIVLNFFFFDG